MDTVIQFRGTIYENGYGLIAQKVMRDKDLSPVAKSIYAYICSFAGVGKDGERSAFPGVQLMMAELGIKTEDTYYKHRKQLLEKGYITIEKRRQEGKFENNIYYVEAVPVTQPQEENVDTKRNEPYPKKSGKAPTPKKSSTVKSSTKKQGTNINRFTINSFNIEEEEESITLADVISFMNDQIDKREITNKKTLTAIFEVAEKCKAIGTNDREAMENYCIKVVEEKMAKLGQKQKQSNKPVRKQNKPTRIEVLPDWFDKEEKTVVQGEPLSPIDQSAKKQEIDDMLKKVRA